MGCEVWYNDLDNNYCVYDTVTDRIMVRNLKTPEEVADFITHDKSEFREIWIVAAIEAKEKNYWGIYWIPKTLQSLKWFLEKLGFKNSDLVTLIR